MKTKHTPGPWIIQNPGWITGAKDQAIASVYPCKEEGSDGEFYWIGNDELIRIKNSHLIAAAPELLQSLKNMLEIGVQSTNCRNPQPIIDVRERAQAAIAKAEGEQNV